ncbi:MAG TPA: hypothetical protein DCS07_01235 [Bdellovibrionales bacterium]|nr:MAG: hypothetical protein A2X97_00335 [Bdellovibrionales bacterium GWA1_52_35]OFZ43260.1 MAG: hypothetical protein A2070_12810 [Bdellovibrionales bacterium GWC1_52_8]HAR41250.1 hypothetical protein [Bdellovibrionales bacterium]HCM41262.1 hypothetical protein [Bdellovibrionales bacterium]
MTNFVVTTSIGGVSRSQIWDSSTPLPLGHPLKWIIEKTETGVRARELGGPLNQVRQNSSYEVTYEELDSGATLRIPSPLAISIRKTRDIQAFTEAKSQGNALRIYTCLGNWVQKAEPLQGNTYHSSTFSLLREQDKFRLNVKREDGLLAKGIPGKSEDQPETLAKNASVSLSAEQLASLSLSSGGYTWHFGFIQEFAGTAADFNCSTAIDADTESFKKYLRYTAAALGLFMLTTILWPKGKPTDELIPPQVAKIVLTAPKKTKDEGHRESGGATQAATAQNNVQKAAVVQAFRAKALKNSISGLLKGGMTRLLAQSDLVAGSTNTGRKIFDSSNTGLLPSNGPIGMNSNSVMVASLGGAGGGTAGGIGYGKGHRAGIQGQGQSHVSLDIGNSQVEEGLTKDEVGEVIHRHLSEVRYCYESAILRTPGIEGRLIVNFTIGSSGAVKASEIKTSNLPDPRLDDCILRRLVTWKFPQTKGGIDVAVTYPFIFKMLGLGR